jgi:hypothetical protein
VPLKQQRSYEIPEDELILREKKDKKDKAKEQEFYLQQKEVEEAESTESLA